MTKSKLLLILTICLCLLFSACSKNPGEENELQTGDSAYQEDVEQNVLKLPYAANDSLNPFYSLSEVNSQLDAVLFEPLYKLDSGYNEIPVLASSGSVKGNSVTVTLTEASFSDGSRVTADDIVYSFAKAKKSNTYSSLVFQFESAVAQDEKTVVFEMNSNNVFALSALTFPIVKNGTAEDKDVIPVGSGPYVVTKDSILEKNALNNKAKINKIELVDVADAVSEAYVLQTGDISFCFDSLHGGSYNKINAVTRNVVMNNLVYLGFNGENAALSDVNVRQAVLCAVNVDEIAQNAFRGNAVATRLPFNPNWSRSKEITPNVTTASAVSFLEKSGYSKLNDDKIRSNGENALAFELLVNKDNKFRVSAANMIRDSLNELGFSIRIRSEDFETYANLIKNNDFDMYIGEVKLGGDMFLGTFFFENGLCSNGINPESESVYAYEDVLSGSMTVEAFSAVFMRDVPFAPICFRTGICASLRGVNLSVETPKWYADIEKWSY